MKDQASRLRELVASGISSGNTHTKPGTEIALSTVKLKEPREGRIIAVTSGKGGVGKTTLAVNLALLLAEMSNRVLIVDADLGLANVDLMLGMKPGRHMGHMLMTDCSADDVAETGPCNIKVISGGSGLRELADAGAEQRAMILQKLKSYYDNFDYVLVDTSPGIGGHVVDFLREADDILLVTTPEPTSLRDAYAAMKAINGAAPQNTVTTVVNSATPAQARVAIQALNQVTSKFLDRECKRWHQIESDYLVARAIRDRKPLVRTYPGSPAVLCLRQLARKLAERAHSESRN